MVITLQGSLKLSDNEQKAFETKERLDIKHIIEEKSAKLFKISFKYIQYRKNYKNAIKDGNHNRQYIIKLRNKVKQILYERIKIKKDYKSFIQYLLFFIF